MNDDAPLACAAPTRKFPEGRTGTIAGYGAHYRSGEAPCRPCADARNADRRVPALPVLPAGLPICAYPTRYNLAGRTGTSAGYQAHGAVGEEPCDPCREAQLARGRQYWADLSEEQREERRIANRQERARYLQNSPEKAHAVKQRFMTTNRDIIQAAKDAPCADCGERYPFYVMQFDHRPGTEKLFNIGQTGPTCSRPALYSEIEKCDVVCGNCHSMRTHERGHYYGRRPRRATP